MVTDLLPIGRTAVDPALESFAQNGIEGLLHAEIHDWVGEAETDGPDELVYRRLFFDSLEQQGPVYHAVNESLQVTLRGEDVDRQADAQNWPSWNQIFGHFGEDELEDSLLVLNLFLVDEDHAALLVVVDPLVLPDGVPLRSILKSQDYLLLLKWL